MSEDLFFRQTLDTSQPVDLVFGLADIPIPENVFVNFATTLAPPAIAMVLEQRDAVLFSIALAAPAVSMLLEFDNLIYAGPSNWVRAGWSEAARLNVECRVQHEQAVSAGASQVAPWVKATPVKSAATTPRWMELTPQQRLAGARWQRAAAAGHDTRPVWQEQTLLRRDAAAIHQTATRASGAPRTALWQAMSRRDGGIVSRWDEGSPLSVATRVSAGQGRAMPRMCRAPWQEARHPPPGKSVRTAPVVVPPELHLCYTPPPGGLVKLLLADAYDGSSKLFFICEGYTAPIATVVVPVQRVYMVSNNVTLTRIDTGAGIVTLAATMQLDETSWTWGFNASIALDSLADVEPGSDGAPAELLLTINGVGYRVLAEQLSRERAFASGGVRVSGRGRAALLDDPYSVTRTFANDVDRSAQQLMADVLTDNGAAIGWGVDWNLSDWLVPAGVFSHSGTYVTALDAIAKAAGGYLQPHPVDPTLRVLARYPSAPWDWAGVTPDFELPSALMTRESISWTDKPRYNRVYVSGTNAGVLGRVTRAGTAGDLTAQMVTDALITEAVAARQRGTAILSDVGRQALVALRLPVLADTGVIEPGKFVRYVDGAISRLGIVRSVSVEIGAPDVFQTIGVETHV